MKDYNRGLFFNNIKDFEKAVRILENNNIDFEEMNTYKAAAICESEFFYEYEDFINSFGLETMTEA